MEEIQTFTALKEVYCDNLKGKIVLLRAVQEVWGGARGERWRSALLSTSNPTYLQKAEQVFRHEESVGQIGSEIADFQLEGTSTTYFSGRTRQLGNVVIVWFLVMRVGYSDTIQKPNVGVANGRSPGSREPKRRRWRPCLSHFSTPIQASFWKSACPRGKS